MVATNDVAGSGPQPGHGEIRRICGDLVDWKIGAILGSGAQLDEIETAAAWASGEDDVMGDARRPLEGRAAVVYDILQADEEFEEDP